MPSIRSHCLLCTCDGTRPAGLYEELGADVVGCAVVKDDALPGHRIRDRVYALLDHPL